MSSLLETVLLKQQAVKLLLGVLVISIAIFVAAAEPNSNCSRKCGSLHEIPYPFGTSKDCYLDSTFLITCNTSNSSDSGTITHTPYLREGNIKVLNISLDGELQISSSVAHYCYNFSKRSPYLTLREFPISYTKNVLTVIGCDTRGFISSSFSNKSYTTGCVLNCDSIDGMVNGSCSGLGCCQTHIPDGLKDFEVWARSPKNHSKVSKFNPCSFAFVVEEKAYNFSTLDLQNMQGKRDFPLVLDWAVGNQTCEDAKKNSTEYACKAVNSECSNSKNSPGYLCNCSSGYYGNPYLLDGCKDFDECETLNHGCAVNATCVNLVGSYTCSCPMGYQGDGRRDGNGCPDINECETPNHGCAVNAICDNDVGSYSCSCPMGYQGNGWKNGTGCTKTSDSKNIIIAVLCISISLLVLLLGGSSVLLGLKRRKLIKLQEKYFQQNGGLMLQEHILNHGRSMETTKIFSNDELKKATNNYDESRVLGKGGYGTVYRGVLSDNKEVAIKKSIICDTSQIEQFINEVILLTQINHRNVVKLIGCCLETEVPLLVYEFITNGTLYDHIHDISRASSLPWERRLKIATETARALAYLHFETSMPIIHRDVKSTNILLDANYTAKVADFGASRLIALDQVEITTLVQGTLGYLDPEYFQTGQLTEKSDVYSFGVVLAELLTGEEAISSNRPESYKNLAMYFGSAVKEDRLLHILEDHIVNEANIEPIKEVSNLAKACLRLRGEDRPTMMEVATELEGLRIMEKHPWEKDNQITEETEYLLSTTTLSLNIDIGAGSSVSVVSGHDSMINQLIKPLDDGR